MAEYIEREAAINCCTFGRTSLGLISELRRIPAADVRPVVRGRWIRPTRVPDSMLYECSVCGFDTGAYTFNFCPNCGAMMEEH